MSMSTGQLALGMVITAGVFAAIDFVWLTFVANTFYKAQIGQLLAPKPNLVAAILFYALYVAGIMYFVVAPAVVVGSWSMALVRGALYGLFCYGTYDLTNLATLANWPVRLVVVDMIWGTTLSAAVGAISTVILRGLLHA